MSQNLYNLRTSMENHFDIRELRSLVFDFGIDIDSLNTETKSSLVRELIHHFKKHNKISKLLTYVQKERPNVAWPIIDSIDLEQAQPNPKQESPERIVNHFHGTVVQADQISGNSSVRLGGDDNTTLSGNFSGSQVNVKSTLSSVQTSIRSAEQFTTKDKDDLTKLILALEDALTSIPEPISDENIEGCELATDTSKALVKEAQAEKPSPLKIKINGNNLKMAAESLAAVAPAVIKIADQIVTKINELIRL